MSCFLHHVSAVTDCVSILGWLRGRVCSHLGTLLQWLGLKAQPVAPGGAEEEPIPPASASPATPRCSLWQPSMVLIRQTWLHVSHIRAPPCLGEECSVITQLFRRTHFHCISLSEQLSGLGSGVSRSLMSTAVVRFDVLFPRQAQDEEWGS